MHERKLLVLDQPRVLCMLELIYDPGHSCQH